MRPASERQKRKLTELGIEFEEDISWEDAKDLLRDNLPEYEIKLNLTADCLVELSEVKAGEM